MNIFYVRYVSQHLMILNEMLFCSDIAKFFSFILGNIFLGSSCNNSRKNDL